MSEDGLVRFLSTGASYGLPGQSVERIETHCSIVFLVNDNAFKLKRPIAFSALDYRSVEQREAACRREVELNRRTAPELYLGVRAVHRDSRGEFTFEDRGPAVDWVVVMRRFDQSALLDRLADEHRLTRPLLLELADEIARFHASAAVNREFGGAAGLRDAIAHNRRDQQTVGSVLDGGDVEQLFVRSTHALDRLAELLDERRARGHVRLCHGDLRLANICLWRGHPTLFDAIEFADALANLDVLHDLAFLLMDLDQRGLGGQANLVFNRYLDARGDNAGLRALPLMISVRAGTRAFSIAASSYRKADPEERRRLADTARGLLRRAADMLQPAAPRLVAVAGVSEAERSAVIDDLAPRFRPCPGARIVGIGSANPDVALKDAAAAVAEGYSAVVDAGSADRAPWQSIDELAARARAPLIGLWLGDAHPAPPSWHVLRGAPDFKVAARALVGFGVPPLGREDLSPPRP